eukprot:5041767-Pyramimonas_sp.AAC.1
MGFSLIPKTPLDILSPIPLLHSHITETFILESLTSVTGSRIDPLFSTRSITDATSVTQAHPHRFLTQAYSDSGALRLIQTHSGN